MKKLLIFAGLILLTSTFAIAEKMSKAEVDSSLAKMEQTGMFTKEQIAAARVQLESMDKDEMKALYAKGKAKANDPEVQAKARELAKKLQQK